MGRKQIGKGSTFINLEEADWVLLNPIYNNLEGIGLWISSLVELFKTLEKFGISARNLHIFKRLNG